MPDAPSMRERMLAGELYIADDPELAEQSARARRLRHRLSMSDPPDIAGHRAILTELLASFGEGSELRPPFYCDYGYQTSIGARCFVNWGLVALDVAGDHHRRRCPDRTERSAADRHPSDQSRLAPGQMGGS